MGLSHRVTELLEKWFDGTNKDAKVQLTNGTEEAFITNNALDVNVQDQTTEIVDLHLSQFIQDITIVTNATIDDVVITISSLAEPTDGNAVCLKEGTSFYQGEITSHIANGVNWDITLDTPLDFAYTIAGGCSETNINLAVNGSITPVIFSVSPSNLSSGTQWDIVRIMGSITDATIMDDAKFGGMLALEKGIVFRTRDGTIKNIFNAKTNSDLKSHMYDVNYSAKAPAGFFGLNFRRTFGGQNRNGVVIRLCADDSDEFQVIVQDNLTDLVTFNIIAQGHLTD